MNKKEALLYIKMDQPTQLFMVCSSELAEILNKIK